MERSHNKCVTGKLTPAGLSDDQKRLWETGRRQAKLDSERRFDKISNLQNETDYPDVTP